MSSLELQRIRLDQLEEYRSYGWRPVQEVDGAVGATPYSHGHGVEVLVMREMEVVLTKTTYASITLTAEQLAAAREMPLRGPMIPLRGLIADGCGTPGEIRGAFRALAEIGLAVAYGILAVAVALDSYGGPPDPWPHRRTYEENGIPRALSRKVLAHARLVMSTGMLP